MEDSAEVLLSELDFWKRSVDTLPTLRLERSPDPVEPAVDPSAGDPVRDSVREPAPRPLVSGALDEAELSLLPPR